VYTHTQTRTEDAAHTSMLAHTVAHPTCSAIGQDAHLNLIKKYNHNTRIYWSTLVCSRRYFLYAKRLAYSCLPSSGMRPGASPPSPLRSTAAFSKNFRAPPPPQDVWSHAFRPFRQTFHPCPTIPGGSAEFTLAPSHCKFYPTLIPIHFVMADIWKNPPTFAFPYLL